MRIESEQPLGELPDLPDDAELVEVLPIRIEDEVKVLKKLAQKTGICTIDRIADLTSNVSKYPEVIQSVNRILSSRSEPFPSFGGFFCALRDFKDAEQMLCCLSHTSNITDSQLFDEVWGVIRSKNGPVKSAATEELDQVIPDIVVTCSELRRVLPDATTKPHQHFSLKQIILRESSDVVHDLRLIDTPEGLAGAPQAKELLAYYQQGFKYIIDSQVFAAAASKSGDVSAQRVVHDLQRQFGRFTNPVSQDALSVMIPLLSKLPLEIRGKSMLLFEAMNTSGVESEYLKSLCVSLPLAKDNPDTIIEIIDAMLQNDPQYLIASSLILTDILRHDLKHLAKYADEFKSGRVEELEKSIYRRRLEEHQAKYPEKPLDQVREQFLSREFNDTETVPEALLDNVIEKYKLVLARGLRLVELSDAELDIKLSELKTVNREAGFEATEFFALARETFKRQFGVYPYNTQMLAVMLLSDPLTISANADGSSVYRGVYQQIKTGEGKSLIFALTSAWYAFSGRHVDILTSNSYLAQRDALKFKTFFASFGADCQHYDFLKASSKAEGHPDVIYSTNPEMIFAYLSSQLNRASYFDGSRFDVALVDEADNLCLDLAIQTCRIAASLKSPLPEKVYQSIITFVDKDQTSPVDDDILQAIRRCQERYPITRELHPITLALHLREAYKSKRLKLDQDFVVKDGKIVIVDVGNTGRLLWNNEWSHGLHQFVALRNGVPMPEAKGLCAQMSHPAFLKKYKTLACITGTLGDASDREEIREVYNLTGFDVPPHLPSRRLDLPTTLVIDHKEWLSGLVARTKAIASEESRPVLVVTSSIKESKEILRALQSSKLPAQLLNDHENRDVFGSERAEQYIIEQAGRAGMITIATGVAGRGADIIPDEEAAQSGGVHVILSFIPRHKRVEYQARGRAGRQGKDGSSEIFGCLATDIVLGKAPQIVKENLEVAIKTFGQTSIEIGRVIGFVRTANNLIESVERRANDIKDDLMQEVLEHYFTALGEDVTKMSEKGKVNSVFLNSMRNRFSAPLWATTYELLDDVVRRAEVLRPNPTKEELTQSAESRAQRYLRDAYLLCKAGAESLGEKAPTWESVVDSVFDQFLNELGSKETELGRFNREGVEKLLVKVKPPIQLIAQVKVLNNPSDQVRKAIDEFLSG